MPHTSRVRLGSYIGKKHHDVEEQTDWTLLSHIGSP